MPWITRTTVTLHCLQDELDKTLQILDGFKVDVRYVTKLGFNHEFQITAEISKGKGLTPCDIENQLQELLTGIK